MINLKSATIAHINGFLAFIKAKIDILWYWNANLIYEKQFFGKI